MVKQGALAAVTAWYLIGLVALAIFALALVTGHTAPAQPIQAATVVNSQQQLPPCQMSQSDAVRLTGRFQEGCR